MQGVHVKVPNSKTFTQFRSIADVLDWLHTPSNMKRLINVCSPASYGGRYIVNHWVRVPENAAGVVLPSWLRKRAQTKVAVSRVKEADRNAIPVTLSNLQTYGKTVRVSTERRI